jgi:hypothetical protein
MVHFKAAQPTRQRSGGGRRRLAKFAVKFAVKFAAEFAVKGRTSRRASQDLTGILTSNHVNR